MLPYFVLKPDWSFYLRNKDVKILLVSVKRIQCRNLVKIEKKWKVKNLDFQEVTLWLSTRNICHCFNISLLTQDNQCMCNLSFVVFHQERNIKL
jgi:hypothetical protein